MKVTLTFCIFCKRGRISARIQQRDYVADAGSLLIIFSGQILENVELSEDCIVIFVAVDSEYIMTEIRGPHGRSLRQWVLHNQEPTLVSIDEDEALNFEKLCQSLKFIVKNSDSETSDGILSGFTYIFASLLLKWRKRSTDDCAHDDSLPDGGKSFSVSSRTSIIFPARTVPWVSMPVVNAFPRSIFPVLSRRPQDASLWTLFVIMSSWMPRVFSSPASIPSSRSLKC